MVLLLWTTGEIESTKCAELVYGCTRYSNSLLATVEYHIRAGWIPQSTVRFDIIT